MEKEFLHRVVSDIEIDATITIVVSDRNSKALGRLVQSQLVRDLLESAIALIVVYQHGNWLKDVGMTVAAILFAMLRATPKIIPVPRYVAHDDEIE